MSRIAETHLTNQYLGTIQSHPAELYKPLPRNPALIPEGVPLEVAMKFKGLADKVWAVGYTRYSADAILHHIRWEEQIEKGNREFKLNNNWTSQLARWYHANNPERKLFETRKLREERDAKT